MIDLDRNPPPGRQQKPRYVLLEITFSRIVVRRLCRLGGLYAPEWDVQQWKPVKFKYIVDIN